MSVDKRSNTTWQPDILGSQFESLCMELGEDPDGENPVCTTLVRAKANKETHHAAVFIHGMSDYFFNRTAAEALLSHGISVYAIDLRKCGRSHREGQTFHYASDMRLYRHDLDACIRNIAQRHVAITLIPHSTGALAVAEWLPYAEDDVRQAIRSVVYNSPWLSMLGPRFLRPYVGQLAAAITRIRPEAMYRERPDPTYGRSLHQDYNGVWDYNLQWKPLSGFPKRISWLGAVARSQQRLAQGKLRTAIPSLVLISARSATSRDPESAAQSDVVLDVDATRASAPKLSSRIRCEALPGALHDVFLSAEPTRSRALEACAQWILMHP